jgi:hypothetical protein
MPPDDGRWMFVGVALLVAVGLLVMALIASVESQGLPLLVVAPLRP